MAAAAIPASTLKEVVLPPVLGATSEPPRLFDGTSRTQLSASAARDPRSSAGSRSHAPRLYICYFCPYAQRAWVTWNFKGLQDKIKLVAIDLLDKPAWYKEKVYPQGTVPSLEHDGEVKGESLDLIKYMDSHFEGPALLPQDPAKRRFADELIADADAFTKAVYAPLFSKQDISDETVAALDKVEAALTKFSDEPFFLGQFSLADIASVTMLEGVQVYFSHLRDYEITKGIPNLEKFMEEMNKIEAYTQTKNSPQYLLDVVAKDHLKIA